MTSMNTDERRALREREPARVIGAAEVAALLNITTQSFYTRREALERASFPRRIPGLAGWSRPAVTAWIRRNGGSAAIEPADEPTVITIAAAALADEYAGGEVE